MSYIVLDITMLCLLLHVLSIQKQSRQHGHEKVLGIGSPAVDQN
jgi:hypothetical protein